MNAAFEASRKKAEDNLKVHADQARRKGRADHLMERLIESKTGQAVQYARLDDLAQRWRDMGRETAPTEAEKKVGMVIESADSKDDPAWSKK